MNLKETILSIYPTLNNITDFEVVHNNTDKQYLVCINTEIEQPTQAELETAWIEVEKEQALILSKEQKAIDINNIASLSDQLNLIAEVLDTITSESPDQAIIDNAKMKFRKIKDILLEVN